MVTGAETCMPPLCLFRKNHQLLACFFPHSAYLSSAPSSAPPPPPPCPSLDPRMSTVLESGPYRPARHARLLLLLRVLLLATMRARRLGCDEHLHCPAALRRRVQASHV